MESVFKSVGILCICGYVSGILLNISSYNPTEKAIRLVAALYIITTIVSPIKHISFNDSFINNFSEYTEKNDIAQFVIQEAVYSLENTTREKLDRKNISYSSVKVHIHEQGNSLNLDKIEIIGTNRRQHSQIYELLEDTVTADKINLGV